MPTVISKGKKRQFPYNAVGKAQAHSYATMSGGKEKNKPKHGGEKGRGGGREEGE